MIKDCLKCRKEFDSEGPWNRICPQCIRVNDKMPRIFTMMPISSDDLRRQSLEPISLI